MTNCHYFTFSGRYHLLIILFITGLQSIAWSQPVPQASLQRSQQLSLRHPDSAYMLLKDLYTHCVAEKNDVLAGQCLQQMGKICYHMGYFAQSLDYHLQAGRLFSAGGKKDLVADNLNDMGLLNYYNKQPEQARSQYDEALHIYMALKNEAGLGKTYGNIGHLYEKKKQYDSAFYFQQLSLQSYRAINNREGIARIYANIGSIYEDKERYDSAYLYFKQAVDLYESIHNQVDRIEVINDLGDVFRKTGRYQEAMLQTRTALALAFETNEQYQVAAAFRDMAKTFNLLHQDDSAFHYMERSREHLLTIYNGENNSRTAFLRGLNDMERKNHEIEKLKSERKASFVLTAATVIIILLLVVLSMVIINRQRLKIRNERILSEQNRRIYETQRELIEAELKNKQLQEEKLKHELDVKGKELTTHTLYVIQKTQLLDELRNKLEELIKDEKRDQKKQLQQLMHQIKQDVNRNQYWGDFANVFEQVHEVFFDKVKQNCEDLSVNDMRLVALIKMNFSSADIATLLGISQDSLRVSRYRLKKKLNLQADETLSTFIHAL
jgi:tetratricopeptide (TPR) repeat protein/DNA-binding CsgD family transcriptional regulator